jgi:hypothetical protein
LLAVDTLYNLGLQPVVYNPGETNSDHGSFWEWGYNAVWLIESYKGGDFNPGYHSTQDVVTSFNVEYYGKIARLAIATLGTVAGVTGPVASAIALNELPAQSSLSQNYPNPFNPTTKIQFTIVNRQSITLKLYDVLGRAAATLVNEVKQPGTYTVEFDGSNLASGVYFYRLQAGEFVQTRKLVLLR